MTPKAAQASEDLKQISDRLWRDFDKVSDEQLNWRPSQTARSSLGIVAHCGFSLGFIGELLGGKPYPAPTTAQADAEFLEMEKKITTRAQATELWDKNFQNYLSFLEGLTEADMSRMIELPFKLGSAPLDYMVAMGAIHTREHVAQLEYLQTIYGDREW